MKKLSQCIFLISIALVLSNCQVLKGPVAVAMRPTLPTPEIDTLENKLPFADYSLGVKGLDGNMVNMADYKGKVIFLNFWATWCLPCVAELPSINKLYNKLKGENIAFLLVSNEKMEKVKAYHQRKKYDVPFHIIDEDGNIPRLYYSESIPTTYIINKEGRVVKVSVGAEDWDDDEFIKSIKKLF
ncbi:MAG: thioredoxin [Flavobacteriales bacterium]|nr:MAG: thioredoxin [Flavobacteriales bacterium]